MIYLDYQATTPLAPEARDAMLPWLGVAGEAGYGNPHSSHKMGRAAAAAVEAARTRVLTHFGEGGRLFFTSGATEAANWAIKGALSAAPKGRTRIVTIATEHACVLDTAIRLGLRGADVVVLPVDRAGLVDMAAAAHAIDDRTVLVAAMLVNNEIGVVQPIAALGGLARAAGALMFCDAVQAFGRVPLPIDACDMIAVSAHKIHGPKGVGALWIRDGVMIDPLLDGGGQEGGLRSGTLSPALCAGFGSAASLMEAAEEKARVDRLWDHFREALGDGWTVNGDSEACWRGNLNVRRDGLDVARLMSELRNVALSAGSACASGSGRPSHVLKAMGLSDAQARSSLRLGFGRYTTDGEIDLAAAEILAAVQRQQAYA